MDIIAGYSVYSVFYKGKLPLMSELNKNENTNVKILFCHCSCVYPDLS